MDVSPLSCATCKEELQEPRLLPCLHTVCSTCATSCGACCSNDSVSSTSDVLANFLQQVSNEASDTCANCDEIAQPMFFCETCQQSLCQSCRNLTHSAKMFAKHKIIHEEERSKVHSNSLCEAHNEPYILFRTKERKMACIVCFNETALDERAHLVPVDVGHQQLVEKILHYSGMLKQYQDEKREEADVRNKVLTESSTNLENMIHSIEQLCKELMSAINSTKEQIIEKLEDQQREVRATCEKHLDQIVGVMGPVRLCLMAAQVLCSAAAPVDVLHLGPELCSRIEIILSRSIDRLPSVSGLMNNIETRSELAKALEPYLGLSAAWCPISAVRETSREGTNSSASNRVRSGSYSACTLPVLSRFQTVIDLSGAFGQLFCRIENPMRDMIAELSVLGLEVQEAQRDLTIRRCLVKPDVIQGLIKKCQTVETQLGSHAALLDSMQPEMQLIWQEQLDRVRRQQILFREKVDECTAFRATAREVLTAARQLAPFAACIENMSALIDPRRCHPPDPAPMESICLQISTIAPNSEDRIAAIEKEEQNRKAIQEAKKREEEIERGTVVKGLKHGKGKRKDLSRLLVNTNRERSPGGTDTAIVTPCILRNAPNSREESASENGDCVFAAEAFLFEANEDMSQTSVAVDEQDRCFSTLSISVCSNESSPPLSFHHSPCDFSQFKNPGDISSSKMCILQSLQDVFASQREREGENHEEKNVLASAVRESQRGAKPSNQADLVISPPIVSLGEPRKPKQRRRRRAAVTSQESASQAEQSDSASTVPEAPFVPDSVFSQDENERLGDFEAKERVLKSLKEKVSERNRNYSE